MAGCTLRATAPRKETTAGFRQLRWAAGAAVLWGSVSADRGKNSDFYHEKRTEKLEEKLPAAGRPGEPGEGRAGTR